MPALNRHLLPAILAAFALSCATPDHGNPLSRFEFTQPQMGLPFRIVLYAPDEPSARAGADAAFQRIAELNNILSDYDPGSELSRLSRTSGTGQVVTVSDDLWRVLERAQFLAGKTDGAFDMTVGPAVNLWRQARRRKKLPDPERLQSARRAIGCEHVRLHRRSRSVELTAPNMRLDAGGIAKGYAVDEALAVLKARGLPRSLVSGGGDFAAGAPPPGRKHWRIELPSPRPGEPSQFALLANNALATSGDLFQFVEIDGVRYSHIVDPRTGIGLTDRSLVVVIARDCLTADSISTAVSVLGADQGLRLVGQTRAVEARIVWKHNERVETRASRRFYTFVVRGTGEKAGTE